MRPTSMSLRQWLIGEPARQIERQFDVRSEVGEPLNERLRVQVVDQHAERERMSAMDSGLYQRFRTRRYKNRKRQWNLTV